MIHELKTESRFFYQISLGYKTFEVRKNDRDFQQDDWLWSREIRADKSYTGNSIFANVPYILDNEEYCKDGIVIMSLSRILRVDNDEDVFEITQAINKGWIDGYILRWGHRARGGREF